MTSSMRLAVIAGSGFSEFAGDSPGRVLTTHYGKPSAAVRTLDYGAGSVYFLARHGDDHSIPPHRINYRANLASLELLGVQQVVAVNTVGVIAPGLLPGQLAVPEQLIDYTYGRDHSIYDGLSASLDHIDFTEPFSPGLRQRILDSARTAGVSCHDGGVYAVTQGPRLETAAEVDRLARDGADFIGMTAMPEAAIARELRIDYACLSLIVNFAAGRGEKAIHDDIEQNLVSAKAQALRLLQQLFGQLEREGRERNLPR
ncbi:MAG: S-methyl-5'-thioinosine phosphorylase [Woeseia sp.]